MFKLVHLTAENPYSLLILFDYNLVRFDVVVFALLFVVNYSAVSRYFGSMTCVHGVILLYISESRTVKVLDM